VKDEPKQELALNGAAEPLEAADGLTDEDRARLKAEKKAAKKEKKVSRERLNTQICSAQLSGMLELGPPQSCKATRIGCHTLLFFMRLGFMPKSYVTLVRRRRRG